MGEALNLLYQLNPQILLDPHFRREARSIALETKDQRLEVALTSTQRREIETKTYSLKEVLEDVSSMSFTELFNLYKKGQKQGVYLIAQDLCNEGIIRFLACKIHDFILELKDENKKNNVTQLCALKINLERFLEETLSQASFSDRVYLFNFFIEIACQSYTLSDHLTLTTIIYKLELLKDRTLFIDAWEKVDTRLKTKFEAFKSKFSLLDQGKSYKKFCAFYENYKSPFLIDIGILKGELARTVGRTENKVKGELNFIKIAKLGNILSNIHEWQQRWVMPTLEAKTNLIAILNGCEKIV